MSDIKLGNTALTPATQAAIDKANQEKATKSVNSSAPTPTEQKTFPPATVLGA